MSRKVNVDVELEVNVPVRVIVQMLLRADDDANLDTAIKRHFKGWKSPKADVEDVEVDLQTGGTFIGVPETDFKLELARQVGDYLNQNPPGNRIKVVSATVTDSR